MEADEEHSLAVESPIRVAIRIRPFNGKEKAFDESQVRAYKMMLESSCLPRHPAE